MKYLTSMQVVRIATALGITLSQGDVLIAGRFGRIDGAFKDESNSNGQGLWCYPIDGVRRFLLYSTNYSKAKSRPIPTITLSKWMRKIESTIRETK